jgi:hypothetical protein
MIKNQNDSKMKDKNPRKAYFSPQVNLTFLAVRTVIAASHFDGTATLEAFEATDLFE